MAPKSSNSNTYKDGVELGLERLKKHDIQKSKCNFKWDQHKNVIHLDWHIM